MLQLTPSLLRASYDFLNHTQPFNKWNLPDGEDVRFEVVKDKTLRGWYKPDPHRIGISSSCIGHTTNLILTMAHEMVHLHEKHIGICRDDVGHSLAFQRLGEAVCKVHGFDPKLF